MELPVVNLEEAKFDCVYPEGCEGACCRHGRPSLSAREQQRVNGVLPQVMGELRPEARKLIEKAGYLSRRTKMGHPMVRVVDGWCVFFHNGCVLHKAGAAEGDPFRYKPIICSLFPLEQDPSGDWYIRQPETGEAWDLPCMSSEVSVTAAKRSLKEELAYAERLTQSREPGPYQFDSGENA